MESSSICHMKGRFKLSKIIRNNSNTFITGVNSRFIVSKKISNTKENNIQCIISGYDAKNNHKYNINFEKLIISSQLLCIDESTRADSHILKSKLDMDYSKKLMTEKLSKLKNSNLIIERKISIIIIPKA